MIAFEVQVISVIMFFSIVVKLKVVSKKVSYGTKGNNIQRWNTHLL